MPMPLGRYLAAVKTLSAVEAERDSSNQHELNGSAALRQLLGLQERRGFLTRWVALSDTQDPLIEERECSWYDSRAAQEHRSAEWRLYYKGSPPLATGDLMVCLVREGTDDLVFLIAPASSSWAHQLEALFGRPGSNSGKFAVSPFESIPPLHQPIALQLFELLGWCEPSRATVHGDAERLQERFGSQFPSTVEFSRFARELIAGDPTQPDATLLAWWQREESLFRTFEETLLKGRLDAPRPFRDPDDFIQFSLSVQNRRKSRAGKALENHFEALLVGRSLRFSRNKKTEGDRRPDFILPGDVAYHDQGFDDRRLTMVAAKTTCKDRWRQILNEAARIRTKHLLTLEAGISPAQLHEMSSEHVVLVAPSALHATYEPPSGMQIMNVAELLDLVAERQSGH